MINPNSIKFGIPHPSWQTCGYSSQTVKMAISKVRFLTDTLLTGEKLSKMYGNNPKCSCGYPLENRFHLLLDCVTFHDLREICITAIISVIQKSHPQIPKELIRNRTVIIHLILDSTWYRKDIGSSEKILPNILNKQESNEIEVIGRAFGSVRLDTLTHLREFVNKL